MKILSRETGLGHTYISYILGDIAQVGRQQEKGSQQRKPYFPCMRWMLAAVTALETEAYALPPIYIKPNSKPDK